MANWRTDKEKLISELHYCANEIADLTTLYLKIYGVQSSFYYDLKGMENNLKYKKNRLEEEIEHEKNPR